MNGMKGEASSLHDDNSDFGWQPFVFTARGPPTLARAGEWQPLDGPLVRGICEAWNGVNNFSKILERHERELPRPDRPIASPPKRSIEVRSAAVAENSGEWRTGSGSDSAAAT